MTGEARIHVAAPADRLYDMVSDVTRMHEWSPETFKCEWLDGATGPAVGARFKGTNKAGPAKWSTKPKVVAAEAGQEFAFDTGSTVWRYRFEPVAGGTEVVESFDSHPPAPVGLLFRLTGRQRTLQKGIATTLSRLKAAAERQ